MVQSCSLIDDDLTNCGYNYKMVYKLRLITNMQTELDEVFHEEADLPVRNEIERYFAPVFSDMAHDVDISFYKQPEDKRTFYKQDVIDNNRSEYVFYLPVENYENLAVANIEDNDVAYMADTLSSIGSRLTLPEGARFTSQRTGLFTSRLSMEIKDTVGDQEFESMLYMANCASVLVLDTTGSNIDIVRSEVLGTADEFLVNDSSYSYIRGVVVDAEPITPSLTAASRRMPAESAKSFPMCLAAVTFPSTDVADAEGNYWKIAVYAELPDGKITETILAIKEPLNAGDLQVIIAKLNPDGSVTPINTSEVGASVTLDWKEGGTYSPVI